jgi:alpha-L-arabinofuranosidase
MPIAIQRFKTMKNKLTRILTAGVFVVMACFTAVAQNELIIYPESTGTTINKNIYGHFSEHLGHCIYEGIWVGEDSPIPNVRGIRSDVVEALKAVDLPVLRWPGGCFADEYHWRDGIGPKEKRPTMINTHWGGVVENNHFGTHEFLDLCEQLGTEPFISVNVGSGTPKEMMEWIEYMTSDSISPMANLRRENGRDEPWKVTYLGIGNENWGCGGHMRAEYYADVYRQFQTFAKNYGSNRLFKIACGASASDYHWTDTLMRMAGSQMHGLSLHYYTLPTGDWSKKGKSTGFGEDEWFATLKSTLHMEELVSKHSTIMDVYDPEKRVGMMVDEWGTWYDPEPGRNPGFLWQQNTLRDALVAGINLNIFNNHADRVRMANIAQIVNVLQAMILTDGARILKTPTYHVFDLYKVHHDATLLKHKLSSEDYQFEEDQIPGLHVSCSTKEAGVIHVTLCNLNPTQEKSLTCRIPGVQVQSVTGRILTAEQLDAHNTFDAPNQVLPVAFDSASIQSGEVKVVVPSKSVVLLTLRH